MALPLHGRRRVRAAAASRGVVGSRRLPRALSRRWRVLRAWPAPARHSGRRPVGWAGEARLSSHLRPCGRDRGQGDYLLRDAHHRDFHASGSSRHRRHLVSFSHHAVFLFFDFGVLAPRRRSAPPVAVHAFSLKPYLIKGKFFFTPRFYLFIFAPVPNKQLSTLSPSPVPLPSVVRGSLWSTWRVQSLTSHPGRRGAKRSAPSGPDDDRYRATGKRALTPKGGCAFINK